MIAGEEARAALERAGARPILIAPGGLGRTGEQLLGGSQDLAGALQERGLSGRRVGLWLENSPAAVEAFLAVEWAGATRVPVDASAPAAEAQAVFGAAGVDLVLADGERAAQLPGDVWIHDEERPAGAGSFEPVDVEPERALHLYPRMAAGGRLFGVPISYGNWRANLRVNGELYHSGHYGPPLAPDDVFLTAQQLMHGTGLLGSFGLLELGVPQVVLPRFSTKAALEACLAHRVTSTFLVPGMVTRLAAAAAEAGDRPPLKRLLYGGAPIGLEELRGAAAALGPVLVQLYGRFEGGWPLAVLGIDEHQAIAAGDDALARSCGRPIGQTELRLRPVAEAAVGGELAVRSEMVVREYADPDGWCGLGDLATLDEHGYLYLRGRLDGMINTGSYHVYPAEVEEAIKAVVGVREAMVRGEPDPVWGQAVTAYAVADGPADEVRARIAATLPGRLARYKLPKELHLVDRLPERG